MLQQLPCPSAIFIEVMVQYEEHKKLIEIVPVIFSALTINFTTFELTSSPFVDEKASSL
jgi:hypothetical protein